MKSFNNKHIGLKKNELSFLTSLSTPSKIQHAIDVLPQNFEEKGDSCMSVRAVLREGRAHCIEGALLASLALWVHGERPLLMDLAASKEDDDHVVALFKRNGLWGAFSKSNHAVLGYRDPIYRTLRELALSYAHEYFNKSGSKTLRAYSRPYLLTCRPPASWITGEDAWAIAEALCEISHTKLFPNKQAALLRPIDRFEQQLHRTTRYVK